MQICAYFLNRLFIYELTLEIHLSIYPFNNFESVPSQDVVSIPSQDVVSVPSQDVESVPSTDVESVPSPDVEFQRHMSWSFFLVQ
jgi:hypothetical protein